MGECWAVSGGGAIKGGEGGLPNFLKKRSPLDFFKRGYADNVNKRSLHKRGEESIRETSESRNLSGQKGTKDFLEKMERGKKIKKEKNGPQKATISHLLPLEGGRLWERGEFRSLSNKETYREPRKGRRT